MRSLPRWCLPGLPAPLLSGGALTVVASAADVTMPSAQLAGPAVAPLGGLSAQDLPIILRFSADGRLLRRGLATLGLRCRPRAASSS